MISDFENLSTRDEALTAGRYVLLEEMEMEEGQQSCSLLPRKELRGGTETAMEGEEEEEEERAAAIATLIACLQV